MTQKQTTGVHFVLEATDEERRAIRMVMLFEHALGLKMAQEKETSLTVHTSDVHKHLHLFVRELAIARDEMFRFNSVTERCEAMDLYYRAFPLPSGAVEEVAWMYSQLSPPDPELLMQECIEISPMNIDPSRIRAGVNTFFRAIEKAKQTASA